MAQSSVAQFATELNLPPALLLEQLKAAGVAKSAAEESLSEQDKALLLDYLREAHGSKDAKNKITLTRKQTSEIKKSDATGKARTIQVEVRKKRVLVKRDASEPAPAPVPEVAEAKPVAPVVIVDAEERALRDEEARKQAELMARQAEDVAAKKKRTTKAKKDEAPAAQPAVVEAPAVAATAPVEAKAPAAPEATAKLVLPADSTLHKPQVKPEDKADKKAKKAKNIKWFVLAGVIIVLLSLFFLVAAGLIFIYWSRFR